MYIQAWASALLVQTSWAMPEPWRVGRVTGRLPRFFFVYQPKYKLLRVGLGESIWQREEVMSNIEYHLDQMGERLFVTYSTFGREHNLVLNGKLTNDGRTFFANPVAIENCQDLSPTEKRGLINWISRESKSKHVEIVFTELI